MESSTTQPYMLHFCCDLVDRCTTDFVIKAENEHRDGQPHVAMHRLQSPFLIALVVG